MAISISSSPASFNYGNVAAGQCPTQTFTFTARDPASIVATAVQFKVEANTTNLTQFMLEPGAGWTPSSGEVTSAMSPTFTYGPNTKAGQVSLTVKCNALLPTGAVIGSLTVTLFKNGAPFFGPITVPLQVTVIQPPMSASVATAAAPVA